MGLGIHFTVWNYFILYFIESSLKVIDIPSIMYKKGSEYVYCCLINTLILKITVRKTKIFDFSYF